MPPHAEELRDWERALTLIKRDSLDEASSLLSAYNYTVSSVRDGEGGASYILVSENDPLQRNWGTFLFNRHAKKRLFIHVERPGRESYTLQAGAELFRRLGAEWLCVAGAGEFASDRYIRSRARAQNSVFSRWHEILVDLTHVTVSVHGFRQELGVPPEIVLSNGRTSDEQWGISQISLGVRDSLRQAGFVSVLAMFDSGYASLAGGRSRAGIFSNDSVGFGHWINFALSSTVRSSPAQIRRFAGILDRALDVTGKRISQQVNRAFGLVSPRVVRVDSLHRIMFPPSGGESYRIVSFNPADDRSDTLDIRMGRWMDMGNGGRTMTSVTTIDTSLPSLAGGGRSSRRGSRSAIVQSASLLPTVVKLASAGVADSAHHGHRPLMTQEPLQVHRIPLDKVPVTEYAPQAARGPAPFSLPGVFPASERLPVPVFEMNDLTRTAGDASVLSFLVPLLNPTSTSDGTDYIGVRMNNVLVSEIARLVARQSDAGNTIGLVAERGDDGAYYLRVMDADQTRGFASNELARRF